LADFAGGMTQLAAAKALGHPALVNRDEHAAQQIVVVLVAVRLRIEILWQLGEPLVAYALDVLLHEPIVVAPVDLLVKNEKTVGVDRAPLKFERSRHMPVDVDGLAVLAVAGEIGNVVP